MIIYINHFDYLSRYPKPAAKAGFFVLILEKQF
ncbi:hypothetical protein E9G_07740 [Moraxella catarrhalis 7169]|nr:hypothetical protein E9G_07740 [Moraxella catarrhalis 7169]EGE20130.1 hypothetical protein E9U_04280 [Moraxella catarrhalis BC8]